MLEPQLPPLIACAPPCRNRSRCPTHPRWGCGGRVASEEGQRAGEGTEQHPCRSLGTGVCVLPGDPAATCDLKVVQGAIGSGTSGAGGESPRLPLPCGGVVGRHLPDARVGGCGIAGVQGSWHDAPGALEGGTGTVAGVGGSAGQEGGIPGDSLGQGEIGIARGGCGGAGVETSRESGVFSAANPRGR